MWLSQSEILIVGAHLRAQKESQANQGDVPAGHKIFANR
jgi:hypothetical protein